MCMYTIHHPIYIYCALHYVSLLMLHIIYYMCMYSCYTYVLCAMLCPPAVGYAIVFCYALWCTYTLHTSILHCAVCDDTYYATCIPCNRLYSWHLLHSRQHSVLSSHSRASHSTAYHGVLYQRCPAPHWSHFTPLVLSCWGTKAQPHYQAVHTPVWGSLLWPLNSVTGKLPSDPLSGKDSFITELCLTPAVAAVHSPAEPLVW